MTRDIERQVMESTGQQLEDPDDSITIQQRKSIPLREIALAIVRGYPKRTVLGLALFIAQAFHYNAILFGVKAERRRLEGIAKPLTAVEGAVRGGMARAGTAAANLGAAAQCGPGQPDPPVAPA